MRRPAVRDWRRVALACVFGAGASVACAGGTPVPALRMQLSVLSHPSSGAGDDARLDLGTLSARGDGRSAPRIVVHESVAVRLEGATGAARVSVALTQDTPGCTVRVDGQLVTTVPRVVDPAQRIGATVVHQLELTIARDASAGAFLNQLQWSADTD
jgi:hypothetical protein